MAFRGHVVLHPGRDGQWLIGQVVLVIRFLNKGLAHQITFSRPNQEDLARQRPDGTDRAKAKSNVEETIARNPDIGCLVGLWSYNTPAIISAVKDAGKAWKIPIVGFDEEDDTLQGVLDSVVHATVVQQPYEFGYQSVKILTALARGEDAKIPPDKIVEVPVRVIRKDNVQTFWSDLRKLRGR